MSGVSLPVSSPSRARAGSGQLSRSQGEQRCQALRDAFDIAGQVQFLRPAGGATAQYHSTSAQAESFGDCGEHCVVGATVDSRGGHRDDELDGLAVTAADAVAR